MTLIAELNDNFESKSSNKKPASVRILSKAPEGSCVSLLWIVLAHFETFTLQVENVKTVIQEIF